MKRIREAIELWRTGKVRRWYHVGFVGCGQGTLEQFYYRLVTGIDFCDRRQLQFKPIAGIIAQLEKVHGHRHVVVLSCDEISKQDQVWLTRHMHEGEFGAQSSEFGVMTKVTQKKSDQRRPEQNPFVGLTATAEDVN